MLSRDGTTARAEVAAEVPRFSRSNLPTLSSLSSSQARRLLSKAGRWRPLAGMASDCVAPEAMFCSV